MMMNCCVCLAEPKKRGTKTKNRKLKKYVKISKKFADFALTPHHMHDALKFPLEFLDLHTNWAHTFIKHECYDHH